MQTQALAYNCSQTHGISTRLAIARLCRLTGHPVIQPDSDWSPVRNIYMGGGKPINKN